MRIKLFLTGMLSLFFIANSAIAAGNGGPKKVIYKWEQNGMIYYSHLKPNGIDNVIKLDSRGRLIEDFSKEFGELVEIQATVRPNMKKEGEGEEGEMTAVKKAAKEVEAELAEKQADEARKKNCEIARKNMALINSGEVYEPDAQGNMMRLSGDKLNERRAREQKNVDFYCS